MEETLEGLHVKAFAVHQIVRYTRDASLCRWGEWYANAGATSSSELERESKNFVHC